MLRVWRVSGEELACIPEAALSDVRALKHRLRAEHSFPVSLMELLHEGSKLSDAAELHAPMDLQLVLLSLAPEDSAWELLDTAEKGEVEVARRLLQAGTDKDSIDCWGKTALIATSRAGHLDFVKLLLEAGAAKNWRDDGGHTALNLASYTGHLGVVRLLLEARAENDQTEMFDNTALVCASENGCVEVVRLLLESAGRGLKDQGGYTALLRASDSGQDEVVGLLLAAGADKNLRDHCGHTAPRFLLRSLIFVTIIRKPYYVL